jgi:hypothetical protein
MRQPPLILVLVSAAAAGLACAAPGLPSSRPDLDLPEPGWLRPQAREMLTARMQRHGDDMMFLMASVVLLSHDGAEALAGQIAAEPRIGRPGPGERDTLNALLPTRFFDLQDQLRDRARAVADAARARDDARLVKAYGQLAETCVSCHSAYLRDPGDGYPIDESPAGD